MTLQEAKKVALILAEADGGCASCCSGLVALAQHAFPNFYWEMVENWEPKSKLPYGISVKVTSK